MITLSALNAAVAAFGWAGKVGSDFTANDRDLLLSDLRHWRGNDDVAPHLGKLQEDGSSRRLIESPSNEELRRALSQMALDILRPLRTEIRGLLAHPDLDSIRGLERVLAGFVEDGGSRALLLDGTTFLAAGLFDGLKAVREAMESGALDFDSVRGPLATPSIPRGEAIRNGFQAHSVNTVPKEDEVPFPGGDDAISLTQKLTNILRWNVYAIVAGAQHRSPGIGGHISTFASSADFLTMLLLHFVHRGGVGGRYDHLWLQGHEAPGIYALLYVMGVITEEQLLRFRREAGYENEDGSITIDEGSANATSSYPHPMAMHELWENPSVVMGAAGPNPIHKLIADAYMQDHGLLPPGINGHDNRAWVVIGDASAREPEIQGADLDKAARYRLKVRHLINLNLEGLDGVVDGDGNGNLRMTLRNRYQANGWKVIEAILDGRWDRLLARDSQGLVKKRLDELNDGSLFNLEGKSASYFRENFFGKKGTGPFDQQEDNPELLALLEEAGFTDADIASLGWGGHDLQKIYNAYLEADKTDGPAVVILRTVKGKGMGKAEAAMTTHGFKGKPDKPDFHEGIARILGMDLSPAQLRRGNEPLFPLVSNEEMAAYAEARRRALGGQAPRRHVVEPSSLIFDPKTIQHIHDSLMGTRATDMSTTMAVVKLMSLAMADPAIGRYMVPVFADEADTFGANSLVATGGDGYYNRDAAQFTFDPSRNYRQGPKGRVVQVGISEAAGIAAFTAFGTAYATHGVPMVPMFMCYSKFLLPHIGNWVWSAGDALARGFLFGATAGKTTLNGEGREHADGESILQALMQPHVHTFDLATAYEAAVVFLAGIKRFYGEGRRFNELFHVMLYNEKFPHVSRPETATDEAILKGLYLCAAADERRSGNGRAHVIASGPMLHQALSAREELAEFNVGLNVWSGTNLVNLWRDGEAVRRHNRRHPGELRTSHVHDVFKDVSGLVLGATDWHPATAGLLTGLFPEGIQYVPLGTLGLGPSDRRRVLRRYQGVDKETMTLEVLASLARTGNPEITPETVDRYMRRHGFDRMPARRDLVVL